MTDPTPTARQVAEQHAKALERYARACPAYADGGPGIEESLRAGATIAAHHAHHARRLLRLPEGE